MIMSACVVHTPREGVYIDDTYLYVGPWDYYYYPDIQVYFRYSTGYYYYYTDGTWLKSKILPPRYKLHHDRRVHLRIEDDRPYLHNREHVKKYRPPVTRDIKPRAAREPSKKSPPLRSPSDQEQDRRFDQRHPEGRDKRSQSDHSSRQIATPQARQDQSTKESQRGFPSTSHARPTIKQEHERTRREDSTKGHSVPSDQYSKRLDKTKVQTRQTSSSRANKRTQEKTQKQRRPKQRDQDNTRQNGNQQSSDDRDQERAPTKDKERKARRNNDYFR